MCSDNSTKKSQKVGGNIGANDVQVNFSDLDAIRGEIKYIQPREDFMEQDIKESLIYKQMRYAYDWADESYSIRRKVGALIYKKGRPISAGYNGTPPKEPNICEYIAENGKLASKPNVIHAERNAFAKLYNDPEMLASPKNAALFATTVTCAFCAEQVAISNITSLYFTEMYRGVDGIEYLIKRGLSIYHVDMLGKKITTIFKASECDNIVEGKIAGIQRARELFLEYQDGKYVEFNIPIDNEIEVYEKLAAIAYK